GLYSNQSFIFCIYTLSLHDALPIYSKTLFSRERLTMTTTVSVAPSARRLTRSLRDIGYSFESAIADLVDNSIAAGATKIKISIIDRKSTRLNSSHVSISYAVFCLNK